MEARVERRQQHLRGLRAAAESPYGDIDGYRAASRAEAPAPTSDVAVELAMSKLRPGNVIYVEKESSVGRVCVLTVASRKGGVKVSALTTRRALLALTGADFDQPPHALGKVALPVPFAPGRHDFQREVVARLEHVRLAPRSARRSAAGDEQPERRSPVEQDPDLADKNPPVGGFFVS